MHNILPYSPLVNYFFHFFQSFFQVFFDLYILLFFMGTIPYMYNLSNDTGGEFHPLPHLNYPCAVTGHYISSLFSHCGDFEMREIVFGLDGRVLISVCWLDGLVSGSSVSENIIRPLSDALRSCDAGNEESAYNVILGGGVYSHSVKELILSDEVVSALTHGSCVLIFDTLQKALGFEARSDKTRAVSEPTLEKSLKGGKDSFTETLRTNTALVRRRLCTPALKTVESTVGRRSDTKVSVLYLDGVAPVERVEELARRLDGLDIDSLLSLGILEEAICDCPRSPFPQLIHTERPDRFAMYLAEGRMGILVDGIPVGLITPVSFSEFMRVIGDRNTHYIVSAGVTLLRYLAFFIALLLPAFYVAVAMYHQEMIPTRLLYSIIEAKQGVPFSTALEVIGMLTALSFLQEAGLRLPNPIGDTVSIIGALIVGQAAVDASLVSPIAIIVVALSGIACYTLPSQDLAGAVRLCRMLLLLSAVAAGLFGIAAMSCLILLHLCGIDSFDVSYITMRSGIVPKPKLSEKYRPAELKTTDRRRQK